MTNRRVHCVDHESAPYARSSVSTAPASDASTKAVGWLMLSPISVAIWRACSRPWSREHHQLQPWIPGVESCDGLCHGAQSDRQNLKDVSSSL